MYITTTGIVLAILGVYCLINSFNKRIKQLEEELEDMEEQRNIARMKLGNLVYEYDLPEEEYYK